MKKIKKNVCITLMIVLMFVMIGVVKAEDCIKTSLSGINGGTEGEKSKPCAGDYCANTIGLKVSGKTFSGTAIYGIRLTVMINSAEKETHNFWATDDMKKAVNSDKITRLGKTTKKDYGNYFANANLYNYENNSGYNLHQLDLKTSATFAQYIKDKDDGMSNKTRLNKYLSFFSSKYNSVDKLANIKNSKIKVEPIYVLHYSGKKVKKEQFYAGTSKELLKKTKSIYYWLGYIVYDANDWNVVKNYLKTVYTKKPSNDKRKSWYDQAGSTTGLGFISFNQKICTPPPPPPKEKTTSINVDVYEMNGGFKTLNPLDDEVNGYFFKRTYGGRVVLSDYSDYPKNSESKPMYVEFGYNDKYMISRGPVEDKYKHYVKVNTHPTRKNCKTFYEDNWYEPSVYCYEIYYKDANHTSRWGGSDTNANFYKKDFGHKKAKKGVTVHLQRKKGSGSYTTFKTSKTDQNGHVTFSSIGMSNGYDYRIQIECSNPKECQGSNIYTKLRSRSTSTFMQGQSSRGVTPTKGTDDKGIYYYALTNQINNCVGAECCKQDLDALKNNNYTSVSSLKKDLIELHKKYATMDNLLNFTPKDQDVNTIKNKVSCSVGSGDVTKKESCETTTIGFKENTDSVPLASYAKSKLAANLYNIDKDLFCYVNYKIDFSKDGIIKNNVVLQDKSFLWENYLSNKVGQLETTLHCEGIANENSKEIYKLDVNDNVSDFINNIKLVDNEGTVIQKLNIKKQLTKDDYNVKINSDNSTYNSYDVPDQIIDSSSDGNYVSFTKVMTSNIVYSNKYYADYLTGTVTTKVSDVKRLKLGYGVPVKPNEVTNDGNISFNYSMNQDSLVFKYFNDTFKFNTSFSSSCKYKREDSKSAVRFVATNNPFPGKNGQGRKNGLNWDACYTSLTKRIGQVSNVSCYDIYGEDNNNCPNGDTYCLYGDINCDGEIIMDHPSMLAGEYSNLDNNKYNDLWNIISNSLNKEQRKLVDLDMDGDLDKQDQWLLQSWIYKKNNIGKVDNGIVTSIDFKNRETYIGYSGKQSFESCDSYISNVIDNYATNSNSTETPMYSFTLSSQDLRNIRDYAKNKSYLNFDSMVCNQNGECVSDFITNLINNNADLTITDKSGKCLDSSYSKSLVDENGSKVYSRTICKNK